MDEIVERRESNKRVAFVTKHYGGVYGEGKNDAYKIL